MASPLVSVIVPTFNRAYCVCRTIDSALAQTHSPLEVVVVDDGSTDDTESVIHERYSGDTRVRYVVQENGGVASARNTGLTTARGEFLALLDSDDLWHPWKLDLQLAVMAAQPDVGMVWTEMEAIDEQGQTIEARYLRTFYGAYRWWTTETLFDRHTSIREISPTLAAVAGNHGVHTGDVYSPMLTGNLVHTSTVLLRRERFEKVGLFDVTLRPSGEDYEFHLRTTREGPVAFIDVPAIRYQRGFADRLTRPELEIHMATNFLKVIEPRFRNEAERIRLPGWMRREVLAGAYAWVGSEELSADRRRDARRHLAMSLRQKWWQPRIFLLYLLACLPERMDHAARSTYRSLARGRQTVSEESRNMALRQTQAECNSPSLTTVQ